MSKLEELMQIIFALAVKAGGKVSIEDWRMIDGFNGRIYRNPDDDYLVIEGRQVEKKGKTSE